MALAINPELVKNTKNLEFVPVPSMYHGFFDVQYEGERIAILNGLSSPLQWCGKNGRDIPVSVIDELEDLVKKLIVESAAQ